MNRQTLRLALTSGRPVRYLIILQPIGIVWTVRGFWKNSYFMPSSEQATTGRERKPQIESLNALRFLAAMVVVTFHYFSLGERPGMEWATGREFGPLGKFLSRWLPMLHDGHLAVDFFAIMSGFVLSYVYEQDLVERKFHYGEFMKRRFARIYPLHLATLLWCIAIFQMAQALHISLRHSNSFASSAILPNLLLIQSLGVTNSLTFNYPSWFISAEWFMYLAFPLLALAVWKTRLVSAIKFMLAIALFLGVYYWRPGGVSLTHRSYDFGILRAGLEFFIGLTLYSVYADYKAAGRTSVSAIHVIVIGAAILISAQLRTSEGITVLIFPFFIFACAAADTTDGLPWMRCRWLLVGGEISYAIYMIHAPLFMAAPKVLRWKEKPTPFAEDVLRVFCLVIVVPLAWVVHRYFERPACQWTVKLFSRPRRTSPALP